MIKYTAILFSFLLTFLGSINAQKVELQSGQYMLEDNNRPGIRAIIPAPTKEVKKAFDKFMDDRYKVDMKGIGFLTNKDQLTAEKVSIPEISSQKLDLYANVVDGPENNTTEMTLFGAFGYDIYISDDRSYREYNNLRDLMVSFLDSYLVDYYSERVEEAEEEVEDMRDDEEDVNEDIQSNEENIKESEQRIQELQNEIEKLRKELDNSQSKLKEAEEKHEERRKELERVKSELRSIGNG